MIGFANPLCQLACRTPARQCALRSQNSFSTTLNRIRERLDCRSRRYLITHPHHQQQESGPKNNSPQYQMPFNIHSPYQDHRDRG